MEEYVQWRPVEYIPDSIRLEQLTDSASGLVVVLLDNFGRRLKINFGIASAYRNIMEEMRLSFWPIFHSKKQGTGSFWVVENSEWLANFSKDDLCHHHGCAHYLIITDDDVIDVLTKYIPQVTVTEQPA